MALHRPPAGETMIRHQASENCPCKPRRMVSHTQRSRSRFGSHQGYNSNVVYLHNPLPGDNDEQED